MEVRPPALLGTRWWLDVAGTTQTGRVRDRNEDQFLIGTTRRSLDIDCSSLPLNGRQLSVSRSEGTLLMVADGMGGHGHGDVASAVAIETMAETLCELIPFMDAHERPRPRRRDDEGLQEEPPPRRPRAERFVDSVLGMRSTLAEAMEQSNLRVCHAADEIQAPTIGTTLTVAYLTPPLLYLGHVGDSRCYLHTGERLFRLTTDHTVAAQLEQAGVVVQPDSKFHHVLWSALGTDRDQVAGTEVRRLTLRSGDTLVLCSDGLVAHVSDEEIAEAIAAGHPAKRTCDDLISLALERGGLDNATVVVARIGATDP